MFANTQNISHKGVIIQSKGNVYTIRLTDDIQCESCSVKSSCGLKNEEAKTLTASSNKRFEKGSKVIVLMKEKKGFVAVLIAYVLPFFVLMFSLLVLSIYLSELKAAVFSLIFTALYFVMLYLYQNRLKSFFKFDIIDI